MYSSLGFAAAFLRVFPSFSQPLCLRSPKLLGLLPASVTWSFHLLCSPGSKSSDLGLKEKTH